MQDRYKSKVVDSFETDKTAFNDAKDKYEKAIKTENDRVADIFLSVFSAEGDIPARPELITAPPAYAGPTIDLSKYVGSGAKTWKPKESENAGNAAIMSTTNDWCGTPVADNKFSNKLGYLVSTNDTAATAVQKVGHVFGRLGQGDKVMPDGDKPFTWAATTGTVPHMIVGVYPSDSSDTGITADSAKIEIECKAIAWSDNNINLPPNRPSSPVGTTLKKIGSLTGGVTLGLGLAASLAVASLI